jgi:hypothetical protein
MQLFKGLPDAPPVSEAVLLAANTYCCQPAVMVWAVC